MSTPLVPRAAFPRLIVRGADAAIEFHHNCFGAGLIEGFAEPDSLAGLEDCGMVAEKMLAAKAEVVIPIKDRPYGKREGRMRDPFGHLWILSRQVAG